MTETNTIRAILRNADRPMWDLEIMRKAQQITGDSHWTDPGCYARFRYHIAPLLRSGAASLRDDMRFEAN